MCGTQVSILGVLANDPATVPNGLPWTVQYMQFYVIQTGLFSETISFWHFGI